MGYNLPHRTGRKKAWRGGKCYLPEDWFPRAFPTVLHEISPVGDYFSPEQVLRGCYSSRCLDRFGGFLGLVEIQRDSGMLFSEDFRLRKLPLLDHVVQFHL